MMIGVWKRLGFKYNEQLNLDIEYAIKEYKKMIKISKAKNLKDSFEKLTEEGRIFGEGFVNLEETLISEINRFLEETEGLTNKEKEMVMLLKPKTSLRNYFARMISGLKLEEFEK